MAVGAQKPAPLYFRVDEAARGIGIDLAFQKELAYGEDVLLLVDRGEVRPLEAAYVRRCDSAPALVARSVLHLDAVIVRVDGVVLVLVMQPRASAVVALGREMVQNGAHSLHASVAGPVRHLAQEGSGVVVGVVARERHAAAIKEAALSALRLGAEGVKQRTDKAE